MTERGAALRLRGRHGPLETRVRWPAAGASTALAVAFGLDEERAGALCDASGAVVVAVRADAATSADDAWAALHWAAAHARELSAEGDVLVLGAGAGRGAARAAARRAAAEGWPPVTALELDLADLPRTAELVRRSTDPKGTR